MTMTDCATKLVEAGCASDSLDPKDWDELRRHAHAMLDEILSHIETIRSKPVWQAPPEQTRARFHRPLPIEGRPIGDVLEDVKADIVPYATGNLHPRFMGWVHGAGTPVGMIAEMIAAGLNMNCGGRDHIGIEVERQITCWLGRAFGYPQGATGLFLTGSSMANFLAVTVAKVHALGPGSRVSGLRGSDRQLVAYAAVEAHGCVSQAMELSGLGSENLRLIPVDAAGCMDVEKLRRAIATDRTEGAVPFLVVATAGTVNTGAIDPLSEISEVASSENLWFHVDGAIGALTVFSEPLRSRLAGIQASDSIALDFHKWGHVPYDAGFLLVRDGDMHKQAFANPAAYLQRADRGLAAGGTWPCDLGPDLSRGFRALKTWMTIETLGTERLGAAILKNCQLAQHLRNLVEASTIFEMKAPVALNIVCFGVHGDREGKLNRELIMDLHMSGQAAPSCTTIDGEAVIRCAIVNHRTTQEDVTDFFEQLTELARSRMA
jgi:glutamate/tyrosine decarboxylase-like PLP-dependent enzyme